MKTILTTIFAAALSLQAATAQNISGTIINTESQPVEFANVVLLAADSTFICGTVSDLDGKFEIDCSDAAQLINISCIGYEPIHKKISEITDFQNIVMTNSSVELQEVTVKAIAPKTTLKDGAMVTNVQGTVLAKTSSTSRMLSNVPGLITNRDGSLEVIGKGAPEIYINNIKVRDLNELESISPENIKNVEVITSPGARYDASVSAVVKITTLKPVGEGFGFSAESNFCQGFEDLTRVFQEKLDFNYRKKGFDFFGGIRYDYNPKIGGTQEIYNINKSNHVWETTNSLRFDSRYDYFPTYFGVNYQINDNNFVGAKLTHKTVLNRDERHYVTASALCDNEFYDALQTTSAETQPDDYENDLNLYYSGNIGGFSIDFNSDFVYNPTTKVTRNIEQSENYEERDFGSTNDILNKLTAQKLVIGHSLFGGRLDFGGETTFTERTDELTSDAEMYVPSVKSRTTQKGIASFAEYTYSIANKINLKAGIRYEHIDLNYYDNGVRSDIASKVYNEFFPSFSADAAFGKFSLQLAYNEKISRPAYYALSNQTNYANRYLQQSGNPSLKPTIRRNAELTVSYLVMQAKIYYTYRENAYLQYQMINQENPESEIINWINLDIPTAGIQLAAQIPLGIYRPTLVFVTQKQWMDDIESDGKMIDLTHPAYMCMVNNAWNLKNGWSFELNTRTTFKNLNEDFLQLVNTMCNVDFYIHKSFLNNSLNIEAGISDIFDRSNSHAKLFKQSGYLQQESHSDNRTFNIAVKYTLNPAKSKYKGTGAGNDEKERL